MQNHNHDTETPNTRWDVLYKTGAVTAFIITVLLVGEFIVFSIWPQPATIQDVFTMFYENWLVGLLEFDLLGIISYLLFVPLMLALYVVCSRASASITLFGTAFFFVGSAAFFATNTAFPLLSLSAQYAVATTEAQRAIFLAAGQAMLTMFNVNAFQVSYVIVSAGWLLVSVAMLRSGVFSRVCACSGILAGAAGIAGVALEHMPVLGDFLPLLIIVYFSAIVFLIIWVFLSGKRLYRLSSARNA